MKCIYNNNNIKNKKNYKINYHNNNLSPDLNDNNKLPIFTNTYMNKKNNNNNINTNVNNINTFNINKIAALVSTLKLTLIILISIFLKRKRQKILR